MPEMTFKRINSFAHKMRTRAQLSVKVELRAKELLKTTKSPRVKQIAKGMIEDCILCRETICAEMDELDQFIFDSAKKAARKSKLSRKKYAKKKRAK